MATPSKKTIDPFWWALFGAGGVVAAFCIPVLLFVNGLAIPLGLIEAPAYEDALALVQHLLTRLFLFGLITLSMFHWAHRFRFTLYDGLQLKKGSTPGPPNYGAWGVFSVVLAWILLST